MIKLEDSLRQQLLNKGKRIKTEAGFDGLLRAFDLFDDVKLVTRETQTDQVMPQKSAGSSLGHDVRRNNKQMFASMMPGTMSEASEMEGEEEKDQSDSSSVL